MVDIKEKCRSCTHHATCKFSELYDEYCNKISTYIKTFDEQSDRVFNIEITCRHFNKIPISDGGIR